MDVRDTSFIMIIANQIILLLSVSSNDGDRETTSRLQVFDAIQLSFNPPGYFHIMTRAIHNTADVFTLPSHRLLQDSKKAFVANAARGILSGC